MTVSSQTPGRRCRFEPVPLAALVERTRATASSRRCSIRTQRGSSRHGSTRPPGPRAPWASSQATRWAVTSRPSTFRRPVPRAGLVAPSHRWCMPERSTDRSKRSDRGAAIPEPPAERRGSASAVGWPGDVHLAGPSTAAAKRSYEQPGVSGRWISRCIAVVDRGTDPDTPPAGYRAGGRTPCSAAGFGKCAPWDSNPEPAD